MIQANKYKIEKALFFQKRRKKNLAPTIHCVNGNKRPTVVNAVGSLMLTCWEAEEQKRGVFIQTFINFHHLYTAEQRQRKRRCEDCESLYTSRTEGHVQRHTSSLFLLSVNGCYSGLRMFLCRFGCLCFLIQSNKLGQWQCFRCQERHIIIIHHVFSHFSSCYIILLSVWCVCVPFL